MSEIASGTAGFLFGGDYNPEQWPREVWTEDMELMRRAGVNTTTIGVFSWAVLEPREGEFDAAWLDEVIATLDEAGISFFLATPTASPPPWFTRVYPDAMPVRPDGTRVVHGSRDTYAISAPAYRAACRRVARFLAERYGQHPRLRGWHVHNEYGTIDHGPHAAAAFRRWLQAKYGDLSTLNDAWYTAFWSQHYSDWEDILPPRQTQYLANPAQVVDFKRFCSDEMLAAYDEQVAEIRAAGSTAQVTTNFMLPTWNHLDQWDWAEHQDVVSIDHYLDTSGPDGEAHVAYASDLTRSWAGGAWLLMEQNATGIRETDRTFVKDSDRMIRNSLGYIARGSQSSLFFQWRAGAAGAESWHGALVPHTGPQSRSFDAVVRLGAMLAQIAEVAELPAEGPLIEAQIGIVWDANGWWSLDTPHLPNEELSYAAEVRATHRSLWRAGIACDFVRPRADATGYRILAVPSMFALDDATVSWLTAYVEAGGHLVVGHFTGVADENQRVVLGGYPGRLRDLLGVRVEEIRPLAAGRTHTLTDGAEIEQWTERMHLETADEVAAYADGDLAGLPAIARRRVGGGTATYLSARLVQKSRDAFWTTLCQAHGVTPTLPDAVGTGLEVVRRRAARGDYLFCLHHGNEAVRIAGTGEDLLTGRTTDRGLLLTPGEVAVIRERPGATWHVTAV
ncbi:beta-galactosidase [Ruania halotolerans]|uniref:beta-galactosidase n=1 Tax=Ruania halotolerans TaxID=2897773 RepID=UPI001E368928|nr:beta-galactosidase [Ruania halotolerans]UFU07662.1 beta-galactosidase [Ruania halotolerans]